MVRIVFIDENFEEIEALNLNMTIEDAIKAIPNLDFRVGTDRMNYPKTGLVIADLMENIIEVQIAFPLND